MPGAEIGNLAKPIGANVGIYEQEVPTYNLEEEKIFTLNNSIKTLLEGLESNITEKTEQSDEN